MPEGSWPVYRGISVSPQIGNFSQQPETDLYGSPGHYRFAILGPGPETPLRNRIDGFLIQAEPGALEYTEAARVTGCIHFN